MVGDQRQRAESRCLAAIDDRQGEARWRALCTGHQERRHDGRQKSRSQEQRGGGEGATGALVDQKREGDDPHPVAQLVRRARREATEQGFLSGSVRPELRIGGRVPTAFLHKFPCRCTSFRQVVLQSDTEFTSVQTSDAQLGASTQGIKMGYRR